MLKIRVLHKAILLQIFLLKYEVNMLPPVTVDMRGSFDVIVKPVKETEPTQQTQRPQISQKKNDCNCVPYYLCDPTTKDKGDIDKPPIAIELEPQVNPFGFGLIDIRFDGRICEDILEVCCNTTNIQEKPITPKPVIEIPGRAMGCGIRNPGGIDFQIVGNENNEAGFGEFPWTVALLLTSGYNFSCAGSLIHPSVVLTGAHCVDRMKASKSSNLKVRAGEWDTQRTSERLPFQERTAKRIIIHPEYNARTLYNDFALVELNQAFELADHISVVCLPSQSYLASGKNCFATGWGKNRFGQTGRYSAIMKRIPLPIVSNNECQKSLRETKLGKFFDLHPTFICAGGEPNLDTCEGDGGAPLVCPIVSSENRYIQVGTVAWGIGCNENRPGVYAKISSARDWIDQQMQNWNYDTSSYTY